MNAEDEQDCSTSTKITLLYRELKRKSLKNQISLRIIISGKFSFRVKFVRNLGQDNLLSAAILTECLLRDKSFEDKGRFCWKTSVIGFIV